MKATEHYREAEQQIAYAEEATTTALEMHHLVCAQAHATLALAGAMALASYATSASPELDEWEKVAGEGS